MLSILSPCVLPILPLVLGPAAAAHRLGPVALAAGLVVSFVTVGLFVATIGFSIGLDGDVFRAISAVLLGVMGLVLLSGALQQRFAMAAGGVSDAGNRLIARVTPSGLGGQFVLGLLLGTVWSPCVGPTLGAASVLASQGHDLPAVAAVMVAFGAGDGGAAAVGGIAVAAGDAALAGADDGGGQAGQDAFGWGCAARFGADSNRNGPGAGDGAGGGFTGLADGFDHSVLSSGALPWTRWGRRP